jgi:hypothetical protein
LPLELIDTVETDVDSDFAADSAALVRRSWTRIVQNRELRKRNKAAAALSSSSSSSSSSSASSSSSSGGGNGIPTDESVQQMQTDALAVQQTVLLKQVAVSHKADAKAAAAAAAMTIIPSFDAEVGADLDTPSEASNAEDDDDDDEYVEAERPASRAPQPAKHAERRPPAGADGGDDKAAASKQKAPPATQLSKPTEPAKPLKRYSYAF